MLCGVTHMPAYRHAPPPPFPPHTHVRPYAAPVGLPPHPIPPNPTQPQTHNPTSSRPQVKSLQQSISAAERGVKGVPDPASREALASALREAKDVMTGLGPGGDL